MKVLKWVVSLALMMFASQALAQGAPKQLYNKSVLISFAAASMLKTFDGKTVSRSVVREAHIYVSSQGRLFVKSGRSGGGHSQTQHSGPGEGANGTHVTGVRFQGNQMLGHIPMESGASMITATFDGSFAGCKVSVVYGKEGGKAMRIKGVDGVMYDVISMTAVNPTCSVKDGNIFAN